MVKYIPKAFSRENYWRLSENQRFRTLVDVIYEGLEEARTKEDIEQDIHYIQRQALGDGFKQAAVLLADASEGYISTGSRGKRPILASAENIFRVCGAKRRSQERNMHAALKEIYGGINDLLLDLRLTASNTLSAPNGVEFSSNDIRRGVYIPNELDDYTVEALGVLYGFGIMSYQGKIQITGRETDFDFFKGVSSIMEKSFNILQKELYEKPQRELEIIIRGKLKRFRKSNAPNFIFSSKALSTYLVKYIGFPETREMKRKKGISEKIKGLGTEEKKIFSKSYLASGSFRETNRNFSNTIVSELLLLDFRDILSEILELDENNRELTIMKYTEADSYKLHIPRKYTKELWDKGLLSSNPYIQEKAERCFG